MAPLPRECPNSLSPRHLATSVAASQRSGLADRDKPDVQPRDRVRELGDASVLLLYDTHALCFSDDAIALENELHQASPTAGSITSMNAVSFSSLHQPRGGTHAEGRWRALGVP